MHKVKGSTRFTKISWGIADIWEKQAYWKSWTHKPQAHARVWEENKKLQEKSPLSFEVNKITFLNL